MDKDENCLFLHERREKRKADHLFWCENKDRETVILNTVVFFQISHYF